MANIDGWIEESKASGLRHKPTVEVSERIPWQVGMFVIDCSL